MELEGLCDCPGTGFDADCRAVSFFSLCELVPHNPVSAAALILASCGFDPLPLLMVQTLLHAS